MTNQTSTNLDKPLWNVLTIIVASIILNTFYIKRGGVPDDAGMAALVLNWVPIFMGLFTIVIYLISRLMTKKRNWIITVLGMVLTLILVLSAIL